MDKAIKKFIKYIELVSKFTLLVTGGILIAEYISHPEIPGRHWFLINSILLLFIVFFGPVLRFRKRAARRYRIGRSAI